MVMRTNIWTSILLIFALMSAVPAQGEEIATQTLVDQLKEVIERGERDRPSGGTVLRELRILVNKYDWPWQVSLLDDEFRDGDYQTNPAWIVDSGKFWVARGMGLKSAQGRQVEKPRESTQSQASKGGMEEAATALLGTLLGGKKEQPESSAQDDAGSTSEIRTRANITNAFAMKMNLFSGADKTKQGQLEFGPYRGEEEGSGYRLAYYPGRKPSLELLRVSSGRSAVIEIYNDELNLEDNKTHLLEWRRTRDGEMVVFVDGKELLRATDRASQEAFDGFTVVNRGGEYTFSRIALFGTERQ
jgi:hypothetical protein